MRPFFAEQIRADVKDSLTKYTWQMFFAEDDAKIEAINAAK